MINEEIDYLKGRGPLRREREREGKRAIIEYKNVAKYNYKNINHAHMRQKTNISHSKHWILHNTESIYQQYIMSLMRRFNRNTNYSNHCKQSLLIQATASLHETQTHIVDTNMNEPDLNAQMVWLSSPDLTGELGIPESPAQRCSRSLG